MKKQRLIYSLIISVVILSLFLVSTLPSSAASVDQGYGTWVLSGDSLLTFLHLYDISVYSSANADMSDAILVDPLTYQVILDSCGDNVYLYINFSGTGASVYNRYLYIKFDATVTDETSSLVYFTYFSTSVYKRYSPDNGDDGTPDYPPKLSFYIETMSYVSDYWQEFSSVGDDGWITKNFDYPVLNIYTTTTGLSRIDPVNPFLTKMSTSKYYNVYNSNASAYVDVSYNPVEKYGIDYDGASHFGLLYDNGFSYIGGGALAFAFAPITITTNDPNWAHQWNWMKSMTKKEFDAWKDQQLESSKTESILDGASSTLNGYNDFVNANQDRPNIDMNYLLNLDNIGSLSSGISSFASGSAPLFQDSPFFNIFPIIAAPPLVISYLLFGKKG